jgi:hypothetical protein
MANESKKYDIFISWCSDEWRVCDQWNYVDAHEQKTVGVGALIAAALRHYLEVVLDSKEVYFSRDVKSGEWSTTLFDALKSCKLGIFVATEPFLDSMWCNLEFGASKMIADKIIVFKINGKNVYDRKVSLVADNHYQFTEFDIDGIKELLLQMKDCFHLGESFKIEKKLQIWEKHYDCNVNKILQSISSPYTRTYKLRQQFSELEKSKDAELEKLRSEKDKKIEQLKAELKKYKTAKIDELQKQINDLRDEISDLDESNRSLGTQNKLLLGEKLELNNLLDKQDADIKKYMGIIEKHEFNLRSLQMDKDNLIVRLSEKEQELERLQKQLEEDALSEKQFGDDFSKDLLITLEGGVSFVMKPIEGGTFMMGAQKKKTNAANYDILAYDNEGPIHSVTLSDFYIGETQVTQGLWKAVMGDSNNPSVFKEGDNYPVENVSWNDCQNFINELNGKIGKHFRLPTEAEWEYAARGGKHHSPYKYSGSDNIDEVAWYYGYSQGITHPVAVKKSNELGIYDMSGNVWEWCKGEYGDYPKGAVTNPVAESSGSSCVLRGGSWRNFADRCRVSYRYYIHPDGRSNGIGLRLALSVPQLKEKDGCRKFF